MGTDLKSQQAYVGRALPRSEDARFLTGASRFVDDLRFEDVLHAVFVRSPFPHAEVRAIDSDAARAEPEVVGVFTAADLAGRIRTVPHRPRRRRGDRRGPPSSARRRPRAVRGRARAAVVATDPAAALEAAERVVVDYEELAPDVALHEGAPDNVIMRWSHSEGRVDEAFAAAEHVVRQRMRMPRLIAAPLEPRGAVASCDSDADLLPIWVSAQDPYRQRSSLAAEARSDA